MGITFIGHKRIPSCEGGIEIVVDELATRMVARGEQVVVYNRKGHNVIGEEFNSQSSTGDKPYMYQGMKAVPVMIIDAEGLTVLASSLFATLETIRARPDMVHYHVEGPCVPLRLARWAGIRTVTTIYGLDQQRAKWGRFTSMYLKLGERTAAKCTDEVIVLNRDVQQYFKNTYGRETCFVPNGITPVESISPGMITDKWSLKGGSYTLFLGRIVPEKSVYCLIEAFKRLDTNKKLMIAGSVSDSAEHYEPIKQAATGDQRIIPIGFAEGRELEELYNNVYIYVLPSDLKDVPMSLLEALAYGCYCLIPNIAGCADVLRDESGMMHGVTFRHGDVSDLANKLDELLVDVGKVRKIKTGAADYITGRYSWDKVVRATLKLYQGVDK